MARRHGDGRQRRWMLGLLVVLIGASMSRGWTDARSLLVDHYIHLIQDDGIQYDVDIRGVDEAGDFLGTYVQRTFVVTSRRAGQGGGGSNALAIKVSGRSPTLSLDATGGPPPPPPPPASGKLIPTGRRNEYGFMLDLRSGNALVARYNGTAMVFTGPNADPRGVFHIEGTFSDEAGLTHHFVAVGLPARWNIAPPKLQVGPGKQR